MKFQGIVAVTTICASVCLAQQGASFVRVPNVRFVGVSADGNIALGSGTMNGIATSYRWTRANGLQQLQNAPGMRTTQPYGLSWSGGVAAGVVRAANGDQLACRWDELGNVTVLGDLDGGSVRGQAQAVSADGRVVVGIGRGANGAEALVWDQNGMRSLGQLNGNGTQAMFASYSGEYIMGLIINSLGVFVWTPGSGMSESDVPGVNLVPLGASVDAGVIVGQISGIGSARAFRLTSEELVTLPLLPGRNSAVAYAVSLDGRVVVGANPCTGSSSCTAWIWDQSHGTRFLRDVATEQLGFDPGALDEATAISPDGRTIVGNTYVLRLAAPCAGDVDDGNGGGARDDQVTPDDLLAFLQWMLDGDLRADLDNGTGSGQPDASITIDDLLFFLQGYEGGC